MTKPDLTQAIESVKLICVAPQKNANKQWCAWILPSGDLYVEYGRVNYSQNPHIYPCSSIQSAQLKLQNLIKEKEKKGYSKVEVESEPDQIDWSIFSNSEELLNQLKLVEKTSKQIAKHANIRFDKERGLFVTAMGAISLATIAKASSTLEKIEKHLSSPNTDAYMEEVSSYLRLIPLPVGMKLDATALLGTRSKVAAQFQVLKNLTYAIKQIEEIRHQMQSLSNTESRSWWVMWGTAPEELCVKDFVDDRSQYVDWG